MRPGFCGRAVDLGYLYPSPSQKKKTMKVSGWSKGSANNRTGTGYGIRISYTDRDRYFPEGLGLGGGRAR
jgi:hypothetical protein